MKENEQSGNKRVRFDESKNIIKKFAKNERVESLNQQKKNAMRETPKNDLDFENEP